jgi:hypothetical protein
LFSEGEQTYKVIQNPESLASVLRRDYFERWHFCPLNRTYNDQVNAIPPTSDLLAKEQCLSLEVAFEPEMSSHEIHLFLVSRCD